MKAGVHFATENSFCPTPFYEKKGSVNTPNLIDALGIDHTPTSSPNVIEDDDRVTLAGRTPHNKLAETTKNMELFKQNLLNGSMFKSDTFAFMDTQSPFASSNNVANVSVVSPDMTVSPNEQNSTPLSVNSKFMLFGPPTDVKEPKTDTLVESPETNNMFLFDAPTHAERITFAMPAESENNSRGRKMVSTPYFERPKVIKGTPYICKSFASEGSSVDENECPNISHSQESPLVSCALEKVAAQILTTSSPCSSTNSSLDLDDFYTRSVFKASPLTGTSLRSQSSSTASSPAGLFSSPRISPKQSPSSPPKASTRPAVASPEIVMQTVAVASPQIVAKHQAEVIEEQSIPVAAVTGPPPLAPRDLKQIRSAILASQPTACALVTPNSSVNSLQMMFGSPAVLNRAGGVAKGKGPVMSAPIPMQTLPVAVKTTAPVNHKVVETKKAPVPVQNSVAKPSTATASALLNPAQRRPVVNSMAAASPIGKPLTAHPAARVARKVLVYTPKKTSATVSTAYVAPVVSKSADVSLVSTVAEEAFREKVDHSVTSKVEESVPVSHMCNVSIQCSESLLDIVLPVSRKGMCEQHAMGDVTGISSVADSSTCSSQMNGDMHHSPMFTSYYRTQHDSDSEMDDMEVGLFDLLQGEGGDGHQADLSAIATSKTRPTPAVTPLLTNRSVSSHGSGSTTGSKSSMRSVSPSSFRSTAGVLGSARRVTLKEQMDASESEDEEEASLASLLFSAQSKPRGSALQPFDTAQCAVGPSISTRRLDQSTYCNPHDSLSFSMDGPEEWEDEEGVVCDLNETCATDAAVKFTNESIYDHDLEDEEDHSNQRPESRSSDFYDLAETTMTVDQSPLVDMKGISSSVLGAPPAAARLAFQPMTRAKDAIPDMKEITFSTAPGTFVTVMMDFANKHGRPMHLLCHAVPVRYEATRGSSADSSPTSNYFSVSPSELTILPGEDNQLYIKFNPPKGAPGIYSGVVKVRNGQKNFMLLLRGEAVDEQPKEHKHVVEPKSVRSDVLVEHQARPDVEQNHQLHQRQILLQQRIQQLSSKQASPPTENHNSSRSRTSSASSTSSAFKSSSSAASVVVLSTTTATTHINSATPSVIAPGSIRVSPETAQVQQTGGQGGCQFEAFAEIRGSPLAGAESVTVEVASSSPLIRLARSQYELTHCNSVLRVRMMLDASCPEFQSFSRRFLASSGLDSVTYQLGFVTVRCGTREFNIDVIMSRGTCRAVDALFRRSVASTAEDTPLKPSVVDAIDTKLAKTLVFASATSAPTTPIFANASIDLTRVDSHHQEETFTQRHHHADYSLNTTHFQSVDVATTKMQKEKIKGRSGKKGDKQLMENKSGVYFRRENTQFGAVTIGSLTRTRLELCNGTDREVVVYLGDVALPFVLLHNELSIRPRSYVRVPMRFLPTHAGEFVQELVAQTADGSHHSVVQMRGSAY